VERGKLAQSPGKVLVVGFVKFAKAAVPEGLVKFVPGIRGAETPVAAEAVGSSEAARYGRGQG